MSLLGCVLACRQGSGAAGAGGSAGRVVCVGQ